MRASLETDPPESVLRTHNKTERGQIGSAMSDGDQPNQRHFIGDGTPAGGSGLITATRKHISQARAVRAPTSGQRATRYHSTRRVSLGRKGAPV